MIKASIIRQYDFNLAYAKILVADLSPRQMTMTPVDGLENHPSFTLGHLVSASAMVAEDLGAAPEISAGWHDLFSRNGPGDPRRPDPDKSKYPDKETLLLELNGQHEKVKKLLQQADDRQLAREIKWRFGYLMPTLLDVVIFFCINHEAMHLGQLSAWRRAMGLPPALTLL